MEHTQPHPDRRLVRAARSLHANRLKAAVAIERSERAEEAIRSWLALSGQSQAMLGLFEVVLEGTALAVTKHDAPDANQLPLPGEALAAYAAPRRQSVPSLRAAEPGPAAPSERLAGLSDAELALVARGLLTALSSAELAPLLARHEAGMRVHAPSDVVALLAPEMSRLSQEQLRVLTLSTRQTVLGNHLVYQGTVNSTHVRAAEVYRPALVQQAARIVVAHNHPSGDPVPSPEDHALTRSLTAAGDLLDVELVDHIVIAADRFYSFREHGYIDHARQSHRTLSEPVSSSSGALGGRDGR